MTCSLTPVDGIVDEEKEEEDDDCGGSAPFRCFRSTIRMSSTVPSEGIIGVGRLEMLPRFAADEVEVVFLLLLLIG